MDTISDQHGKDANLEVIKIPLTSDPVSYSSP